MSTLQEPQFEAGAPPSFPGSSPASAVLQNDDALIEFLQAACRAVGVPFDRAIVRREIAAAPDAATSAGGPASFAERLSRIAGSLQLRLNPLTVDATQVVDLVRPQAPIGVMTIDPAGRIDWKLLADVKGRKVRLYDHAQPTEPRWQRIRELQQEFSAAATRQGGATLLLDVQPLLPCTAGAGPHADHDHDAASPALKYLRLLRPEAGDVWVILVFGLVIGLLALAAPIAVETLVNTVAFGQFVQPVIVLALILAIFLSFAAALRGVQIYVAEIIQRRLFVRVAAETANRLPRTPIRFWDSHNGPELVNRFFDVATVQKATAHLLLDGTALILQTLVGLAVIAFYHPILLGFDAFLIVVIAGIIFLLGRGAVTTSVEESVKKYETAAWLEELARHPMAFRSRQGAQFAVDQIDGRLRDYLAARSAHFHILFRQIAAAMTLEVIASAALLGLGGWLVIRGELTLGQLVAAELIVSTVVRSVAKFGKQLESFYDAAAAADKLDHLLSTPLLESSGIELRAPDGPIAVTLRAVATQPSPTAGTVRAADLELRGGEAAALLGPAALRRQLFQTITGLQAPAAGHVLLDDVDVRRFRGESLREHVEYIAELEIFHGTLAENIHLGRANVGEAELRAALETACLLDEALAAPDGIDAMLLSDGSPLSRDQAVRLMLARAVAGNPRLLIIDGLFDGLPDDVRERLFANLPALRAGRTLLVGTGQREIARRFPNIYLITPAGTLEREQP